eukprot:550155_1
MSYSCIDDKFKFNKAWWYITLTISTICLLYIFGDYISHWKNGGYPSLLILLHALFDYIAVVIVLYIVFSSKVSCSTKDDHSICQFWGAAFLFSIYIPAMYYGIIGWRLYQTLRNPFYIPSSRISQKLFLHFSLLLICFFTVLCVAMIGNNGKGQFEYRQSFQICFMRQTYGLSAGNVFVIYIPTFIIVTGGVFATVWSIQQLKRRILEDVFELRWVTMKTQTAIITCFTVNHILQCANWIFLSDNKSDKPNYNPYIISGFCLFSVLCDAITWFIFKKISGDKTLDKKTVENYNIFQSLQRDQSSDNISDALRKELITFITGGLTQSPILNSHKKHKAENDSMFFSGDIMLYIPKLIDDEYKEHVIEQYPVGVVGGEHKNIVFTEYAPFVWSYLRNVYGVTDQEYKNNILSASNKLNEIVKKSFETFVEGKNNEFYFFTNDKNYLIKTLTKQKAQTLLDMLGVYVYHLQCHNDTLLPRYFGLHSIVLYSHWIYFVVEDNVFHVDPHEMYTFKGSWIDRRTKHHMGAGKLMKDEDFRTNLKLDSNTSMTIFNQLKKDTRFLSSMNIMDFSLLLGILYVGVNVDIEMNEFESSFYNSYSNFNSDYVNTFKASAVEGRGIYYLGITDILQKWDWSKKMERVIKILLGKDKNGITCIEPSLYRRRFLAKMNDIIFSSRFR